MAPGDRIQLADSFPIPTMRGAMGEVRKTDYAGFAGLTLAAVEGQLFLWAIRVPGQAELV